MVQGKIKGASSKKPKKHATISKYAPQKPIWDKSTTKGKIITSVKDHQKKVNQSIESKIIGRAKGSRESFDLPWGLICSRVIQ